MAMVADSSVSGDLGLFGGANMAFELVSEVEIGEWQCLILSILLAQIGV